MKLFPDHWKTDPVSALCTDVVDCVNKTAPIVDGPTEYKMIRTTNVKAGRINLEDCRYVDEATFIKWTRRIQPKRNDIVLTREAPLGEVGLLRSDESVFLGQRTMLYRANPKKLDQRFLYYSMLSTLVQGQIRSQGSGATVEHLRVPDAESFLVAYPPLDEQCRIAALLSAYDDLIANNQRRIVLLESMAEEIYREWFVRMRFPGGGVIAADSLHPPGWERRPIGEMTSLIKRGISPTYDDQAEYRVINQKCIRNGRLSMSEARTHSTATSEDKLLLSGDILVNSTGAGTLGRAAVFDIDLHGVSCDSHVTIIRPKDIALYGEFLAYTVQLLQNYFESMASGSTGQAELSRELISRTNVLVPQSEILLRFAAAAGPIRKQRRVLLEQNERLAKLRDALLPRLISGKLRVDALDIQFPPSMLPTLEGAAEPATPLS
ncbi:restriction endonuclease subunit S [Lysobacter antibioticus]|uniref:restriction endonuclease subunit S n=1 Tax=Lysobacter antibioticus TaxID=84531 RepID=UPI00068A659B|nr:restriction endonuclease subunit S [Lysobacter antibioticus]